MSDAQAHSVAADEALARAHYDHWTRTYRPGVVVVAEAAPTGQAVEPARVPPPPGWYPNQSGLMQWWDGREWATVAYPGSVTMRSQKDVGIAYLLAILLGGFAAHRFYLGQIGTAIAWLCLWWLGWLTFGLGIGVFAVVGAAVWWFVDLFLIPSMAREANSRP